MTVADGSGAQFDFGRVVSRTFGLIGRNFVPFFVLALIFAGVPAVAVLLIQPSPVGQDPGSLGLVTVLASLVSALAGLVLQAALTRAAIDDLSGRGVSIGAALNTALAILLPMIGLGIVVGVAVVLGMLLLVVPGIYLALRWAVASPVLVVEKLGVFKSMERSATLTQNHRWAIFGLFVLYFILVMILYVIVGVAVPGTAMALYGIAPDGISIVAVAVMVVLQVLTAMVATVGGAAVYFELREIKEGVGVTELAQVFA